MKFMCLENETRTFVIFISYSKWNICVFVYLLYSVHPANGIFVYLYICCIHIIQQMEYLYISTQTNCWKLKLVTGWATSIQVQHSLQSRNLGKQDNEVISIMVMVNHLFLSFRFWLNVCLLPALKTLSRVVKNYQRFVNV